MLSVKIVPKQFWLGAVKWSMYILNRSHTFVVKDVTPVEAWSGIKPFVDHFRVFVCISHFHVPDAHKKKLDGKSLKCVLLVVSKESKAYKLYDPV